MQLDNVKSSFHAVICGIPQGSVLGPLVFNIYINDITEASTKFDFIMYADDTTLTSTLENFGKIFDVAGLERELNEEMSKTLLTQTLLTENISQIIVYKPYYYYYYY